MSRRVPNGTAVEYRRNSVFIVLCLMGTFAIFSSTMSKNPVLKPFASFLGTPDEWTGFVASASTIPGILVSLPAASLSDIVGRKKFLLIAGMVFASAPFLYLLVTAWWQLIIVRFYHGFATAIFVPIAEALVAELFPSKRAERISLFSSVTYVGRVIAPILGGAILLVTSSNFYTLYLAVGVAGGTAFVIGLLAKASDNTKDFPPRNVNAKEVIRKMFEGWGVVTGNLNVLVVCFIQACQYYSFGVVEYYLSGYLKESIQFDWLSTGIIAGSLIAVPIIAKPYMGRVSDKIGRRKPIIVGSIVCSLPLTGISFTSSFWVLLGLTLSYGFGFAVVTAVTPALVSELTPRKLLGTSLGFLGMVMDIGQTLGPIISGFILAANFGYLGIFLSLTGLMLSSCTVFALSCFERDG